MKARDLMIPIQDFLQPGNTLREAVYLLKAAKRDEERQGVKGLPVLDDSGTLVGMLSMRDILKAVYPAYLSLADLGNFTWDGMVEALARQVADEKVADHMSVDITTVCENDSLMECVDHIIKKGIRRLPVLNKEGKPVGMIYERDVFFAIVGVMLDEKAGDEK
ncbi:MAG: CBS domain-containing protein [Syntrophales bacterium]|nr:CBS domain-containing protein [Syntrophales bacterium]